MNKDDFNSSFYTKTKKKAFALVVVFLSTYLNQRIDNHEVSNWFNKPDLSTEDKYKFYLILFRLVYTNETTNN